MSLRLRLIIGFTALVLLLGGVAGWGLQRLAVDLDAALGETATSVGRAVVHVLRDEVRRDAAGEAGDAAPRAPERRRIVLHRSAAEGQAADADALPGLPDIDLAELARSGAAGREMSFSVRRKQDGGPAVLQVAGGGLLQEVPLPPTQQQAVQRFQQQLAIGLVLLVIAGALAAAWLAARITRPLAALGAAAGQVGHGRFDVALPEDGPQEVRQSIAAFNRMSADLARLDAEATALRADRELAELGEIGRGLAHSLRNPLHALGLSLDALSGMTAGDRRSAARIATGREQLQRIDQALRGFLALAAGAASQPEAVRLRPLVDDVVLEASQRAEGRVHFERDAADLVLSAVPAELRILLHTLVVNALEASPDDGTVRVAVRAYDDDGAGEGGVLIEVCDDGAGVAPEVRARLFQPHTSSKPTGAGMGLFLAERLARLRYRGRLQLFDRFPQGTLARLELQPREAGA
jgi:signal transduction histidine kinase